jgi:hypothetical protein
MPVLGLLSYSLEVPDIAEGVRFYADAGLVPEIEGDFVHNYEADRIRAISGV